MVIPVECITIKGLNGFAQGLNAHNLPAQVLIEEELETDFADMAPRERRRDRRSNRHPAGPSELPLPPPAAERELYRALLDLATANLSSSNHGDQHLEREQLQQGSNGAGGHAIVEDNATPSETARRASATTKSGVNSLPDVDQAADGRVQAAGSEPSGSHEALTDRVKGTVNLARCTIGEMPPSISASTRA